MSVKNLPRTLRNVAIVLVVAGLLLAGGALWRHFSNTQVVDSYQACAAAGNPIQTSYPAVCVSKDGKRFVDPNARPPQAPQLPDESPVPLPQ